MSNLTVADESKNTITKSAARKRRHMDFGALEVIWYSRPSQSI